MEFCEGFHVARYEGVIMTSILDYVPGGYVLRDKQREVLLRIEEVYDDADVIGVEGPTALGKSLIAMTVAAWVRSRGQTVALTKPTKILVEQDATNYQDFPVLRSSWDMKCQTWQNVGRAKIKAGRHWRVHLQTCKGCQSYENARNTAIKGPAVLCNAYTYLAHRAYKDVLVVDEGHHLVHMLQDLHTKKWWYSDTLRWPKDMWSRKDVVAWLDSLEESELNRSKLRPLLKEVSSLAARCSITRTAEKLRGKLTEVLKMVPLDMRGEAPLLWPRRVKKILLMSATMHQTDLDTMGLGTRRCIIIPSGSPIPPERRPIYPVCATYMSRLSSADKWPKLAEFIKEKMEEYPQDKGIIHVTYDMVKHLKPLLQKETQSGRILWHGRTNKIAVWNRFQQSKEPKVMICSGMYEGVDLPHDAGRWQVLAKIPWPSLGDPATAQWAKDNPQAYTWETLKLVIQACGRISRTPDDYGATYIYDKSLERLLRDAEKWELIPRWWEEALVKELS